MALSCSGHPLVEILISAAIDGSDQKSWRGKEWLGVSFPAVLKVCRVLYFGRRSCSLHDGFLIPFGINLGVCDDSPHCMRVSNTIRAEVLLWCLFNRNTCRKTERFHYYGANIFLYVLI